MLRRCLLSLLPTLIVLPALTVAQQAPIRLRDLYDRDLSFSDFAVSLDGYSIRVDGYMAPPLKAEAPFFVLTKMPMAVCPFCEPGSTWPDDILPVYSRRIAEIVPFNAPIRVTGTLSLAEYSDPDTGFYAKLRLVNATHERL